MTSVRFGWSRRWAIALLLCVGGAAVPSCGTDVIQDPDLDPSNPPIGQTPTSNPASTADSDEAIPALPKPLAYYLTINPIHHRINCGGPDYTDPDGNLWVSDAGFYNTGKVYSVSQSISGTSADALFQTERFDKPAAPNLRYSIPVPVGEYQVRLHFSENYSPLFGVGRRKFDVLLEGAMVLDDYDIFARSGSRTAVVESFDVIVNDGAVTLDFVHVVENPKIAAIEVISLDTPSPPQIEQGATASLSVALNSLCPGIDNQLTLSVNDPDTAASQLTWSVFPPPAHGVATIIGEAVGRSIIVCYQPDSWRTSADAFTVRVEDDSGGGDSILIPVDISGVLPSATIHQPAEAAVIDGDSVTVVWSTNGATAGVARVRIRLDSGTPVESALLSGQHAFTGVAAGLHHATVELLDASGAVILPASATAQVAFTMRSAPPAVPIITLLAPQSGASIMGSDVTAQWAVSGDTSVVDHVHLRLDDGPSIASSQLAGSHTLNGVPPGSHRLTASLAAADHSSFQNPEATAFVEFTVQSQQPVLTATPGSLHFGLVSVGAIAPPQTVTLRNDGQVGLVIESSELVGEDSAEFSVESPPAPFLIEQGATAEIRVSFSPSGAGIRTSTLRIVPAAPAQAVEIVVVGEGFVPSIGGAVLYRLNCGGTSYTDPQGNIWSPDTGFYNVGKVYSTNNAIAGTGLDPLYRVERYDTPSAPEMVYSFPVTNGAFRVRLHFAEIYAPLFAAGRRVFDVRAEGETVLDDLDVYARVGGNSALVETFDVNVTDGDLDIEFIHNIENPKVSAIEIIELSGASNLLASPNVIEWGHVAIGQSGGVRNVQLTNPGSQPVVVSSMSLRLNSGAGHEFRVTVGGTEYVGDHHDVAFPLSVAIGAGQSLIVPVNFVPTENGQHDVNLDFVGNFPTRTVRLLGVGGANPGHPFLHVVIDAPSVTVDYDQDGSELVRLSGADSHTHELGRVLTGFEWREAGQLRSTAINPLLPFSVGEHTISLTIRDDNSPPQSLTDSATIKIVGPNEVPAVLALYYPAASGAANTLLDELPANSSYAEALPALRVQNGNSGVGGSPCPPPVMVRMLAQIDVLVTDTYNFNATGGGSRRLLINGVTASGPVSLTAGRHQLEARFAVESMSQLPAAVTYARSGAVQSDIPSGLLTHDLAAVAPVINSMPASGNPTGGEAIEIAGLGFFPSQHVTVKWGSQVIAGSALQVAPTTIRLTAPPGTGAVNVRVTTLNGESNLRIYNYAATGPAPVVFALSNLSTGIAGPTTAEWGPDGRLYVGTINGLIRVYSFDDDYNVTGTQDITTIAGLNNKNILGIAFNPMEPDGAVTIYVAHSLIYANGGACFSGSSPYSGQVSRLTGPNFTTVQPLITGLPVSNHDHAINGMAFDNHGDLYICSGGNTNAGIEHCNLGALPESPLSAAVLKAVISKPNFNGQIAYALSATGQLSTDQVAGGAVDVVPGVDLSVFTSGLRNAYDLVFTTTGMFYATDNGPNGGFGAASTSANTQSNDPTAGDELILLEDAHYLGHPNRNRGRYDDRQNVYRGTAVATIPGVFNQMLTNFAASTNGIVEYRANTFNGALRGELLAQKWNGQTYRVKLTQDGRGVLSKQNLPVSLNSLDLTTAPGGVVIGADYSGNQVVIARPEHTAGLAVYDIFPWRAPQTGGQSFIICGNGFGTIGDTSVTIGGVPAQITSVTSTRIRGVIPSCPNPPARLLDVVVQSGSQNAVLQRAFKYLMREAGAASGASAHVVVDAGGNISNSSTYNAGSFEIHNTSSGGQLITQVQFDLSTAVLRDMVFDPDGTAGDTAFKPFSVNQQGSTGIVGHSYGEPRDNGYDKLLIHFDHFEPGETVTFSIDVDPTSIQGAPPGGSVDVGAVSGLELAGARVWITFSDGSVRSGELSQIPGSRTGAEVRIGASSVPAPSIQVRAAGMTPATVSTASQTVRVTGAAGATVRLTVAEGGLYLMDVPNGGFDLDPYEANRLVDVREFTATIGAGGFVDVPVTLSRDSASAGLNHISAVTVDSSGRTSRLSNVAVIRYSP